MNPRQIALLKILTVVLAIGGLILIFPKAFRFMEMAARDLLYFWWLVLLAALAIWLIWGLGGKKK
ncbi:MAG TPA: hypothetical protein VFV23_05600 [Verrucomicrobiae bacterium]|nr:hypothetical protein [Verrucomicrobiae bacterium]